MTLDFRLLEHLSERDGAERWLKGFADAGLARAGASEEAAAAELEALGTLLWSVASLEEDIAADQGERALYFSLSGRAWIWIVLAYFCAFFAVLERAVAVRMTSFAILGIVFVGVLLGPMLWVMAVTWSERRRARQRVEEARQARAQAMSELRQRLAALQQQPFVFRSGDAVVINCPELRWVESEIRRLAGSGSDPQQARLHSMRDQLRAAIQTLARQEVPDPALLSLDCSADRARSDGDSL